MKRNLTLAIEEELLDSARVAAAKRRMSLTELVREYLRQLAEEDTDASDAWQRLRSRIKASRSRIGKARWTREELHER